MSGAERFLCWLRYASGRKPVLGWYLGNGRFAQFGKGGECAQRELDLDTVIEWAPFDEQQLADWDAANDA